MTSFAKNDDLTSDRLHLLIGSHHLTLKLCHYGAGGINHIDPQLLGTTEGCGGLTVGTDEEITTRQGLHIVVRHGTQTQRLQTLHLHSVVDNIAQRIDLARELLQCRLRLRDGTHHTEAKARILIYLDIHTTLQSYYIAP